MKYAILPRRVTLCIYNDSNDINYVASCQININDTHGTIDTLNGGGFYNCLEGVIKAISVDLGLTDICAAMTGAHLRLLKSKANNLLNIETLSKDFNPDIGTHLYWIKITKKPAS